jgi:hypothetical protein
VTTRPDFLVHGGELSILVEARHVAAGIMSGQRQVGRDDWITAPLDELTHPDFMVGVKIVQRESQPPRRAAVTAGVLHWLDGLDRDDLLAGPAQPTASLDADGQLLLSAAEPSGAELFGLQHD